MDASKPMRIVMLEKSGSGKSSLANTLFGQQLFTINHTQNSETINLSLGKQVRQSQNEFTRDLVKKCGGRCHVFDNKYWNKASEDEYRSNRFQVEELLKTIEKTVEENQGGCYTNDVLQAVEENIRQEEQRIRETPGNMSEEEIREQAKVNVCEKLLIRVAGVATGTLLGAFFGAAVMVGMVATLLRSSSESVKLREAIAKSAAVAAKAVAATGAVGAIGGPAAFGAIVGASVTATFAAAGAVRGGIIGYDAAEGAATAGEAAKKTVEAVKSEAQSMLHKTNEAQ